MYSPCSATPSPFLPVPSYLDLVGPALLDVGALAGLLAAGVLLHGPEGPAGLTPEHLGSALALEVGVGEATLRTDDELLGVALDGLVEVVAGEGAVVARAAVVELAVGPEFALDHAVEVFGVA